MRAIILSIPLVAASLTATLSVAQTSTPTTPERCYLLGQIAASHWLDLLASLSSNDPALIDPGLDRVQSSATLYQTLACDMPALTDTMECVLASDSGASPQARARQCLTDAGLSRSD